MRVHKVKKFRTVGYIISENLQKAIQKMKKKSECLAFKFEVSKF